MKIINILISSILLFSACQENLTENLEKNTSEKKVKLWTIKTMSKSLQTKAVSLKSKQWEKGDTIRIKFLKGWGYSIELENYVKEYAAIWLSYANLHFDYVSESEFADVKVAFDMDDRYLTWSTIGKDCQNVSQDEPSINFYGLNDYSDVTDIKGDVLRGFGHVLGLVFEHQSPNTPIQFNSRARNLLIGNYGLSENDVDQLMYFYNSDQTNSSEYDPSSIMVLGIYSNMLVDKSYATPSFNTELSSNDKEMIGQLYSPDTIAENLDSIATLNINAVNQYIAIQGLNYQLMLGMNYDGDEKLPFGAIQNQRFWYGYISHGIVYSKSWDLSSILYCFILKDQLYVIYGGAGGDSKMKVFSLPNLEEDLNYQEFFSNGINYNFPYLYKGKRYITGTSEIENKTLNLEIYNIDDQQKCSYAINFPLESEEHVGCEIILVKDNFMYCVVGNWGRKCTSLYKINLETLNACSFVGFLEQYTNAYLPAGGVNGKYYTYSTGYNKILIIDSNDNVEWKDTPIDINYLFGYCNKLYKTHFNMFPIVYTEFTIE